MGSLTLSNGWDLFDITRMLGDCVMHTIRVSVTFH